MCSCMLLCCLSTNFPLHFNERKEKGMEIYVGIILKNIANLDQEKDNNVRFM